MARKSTPQKPAKVSKETVLAVFHQLQKEYPSAKTELAYESPFQLLISVILSAQCTDTRVNQVTPALFKKYPTAQVMARAKQSDVEALVHSCGFFRMKAKALIKTSKDLTERFDGTVPNTMEDLTSLSGVGRKTASVILNQAFDLPAIAVDTHVKRVSNRLGWSHHPNPEKIETELKEVIPMELWSVVNGLLILHGRRICKARKPLCEQCTIRTHCPFGSKLLSASVSGRN